MNLKIVLYFQINSITTVIQRQYERDYKSYILNNLHSAPSKFN